MKLDRVLAAGGFAEEAAAGLISTVGLSSEKTVETAKNMIRERAKNLLRQLIIVMISLKILKGIELL
jgi:hypothetical protein